MRSSYRSLTRKTIRLSTKGQIVLPNRIRTPHNWAPGTEFVVEESRHGVLLRTAPSAARENASQDARHRRSGEGAGRRTS